MKLSHYERNKEIYLKRAKKWRKNNLIKNKEQIIKYHQKNEERIREYGKSKERKKYRKQYHINRLKNDIEYKIKYYFRIRFCKLLKKQKVNKNNSVILYFGCSLKELKEYLESFFKFEMNWQNYGKIWEIDHIIPCSSFDFSKEEDLKKCWNYKNLEPKFITTKIAISFGYLNEIGNRNKSNKV